MTLSLAAPPCALAAQEAANGEIVVEATLDEPDRDSLGPAKALGPDRVNPPGAVSVTEALSLLPGLVAFEKGGAGAGSYVSIRGAEPNFALVTINGVRVDDPLNSSGGGFDFSLLEPALIQRIAIVSGPQSTAYGADALSGVIALDIGHGNRTNTVSTFAGIGSQGRHQLSGSLGLDGSSGSLTLAGGYSDSEDFEQGSTAQRYSVMIAASPQLGAELARDVRLDLFALLSGSDSLGFPEDSGGPDLAINRTLEPRERTQIALGGTLAAALAPQLTGQMRLGYSQSDFASISPGIAPGTLDGVPPIVTDSRFQRYEAVTSLTYRANTWLSLEAGGSYVAEDGTSAGTLDFGVLIPTDFALQRDMPGLFATLSADLPADAQLSAGLRVDWPEGASARWTPRVGASVPFGDSGARVFANYARGFKRPSLFALGFPLIANPDLNDERSEIFDAGIEYSLDTAGFTASATYFNATYRDLIDFDPALFTNVNRNRVSVDGVEAAITKNAGSVSAQAALTYQSTSSADAAQLRFRPDWTGRLSVRWQASSDLSLSAHGEFSSSFNDSSVPTGFVRNPGYETLAVDAEWAISQTIAVFAVIRNLTDADFERTIGFPEPGRNVFAGFKSRF